jgi:large subunit ribosomal protein L9
MKIILNKDVQNVGEEGDVCDVARGYARNYLLPRGLGLQYNAQNLALIEQRRASIEKRKEEKRQAAMSVKERLNNEELVFTMASGEKGQLFGSVNSQHIAERLERMGIDVERRKIDVPEGTIKSLGRHSVKVKLYGGEEADLTVVVNSQSGQQQQAAGGEGQSSEAQSGSDKAEQVSAETTGAAPETAGAAAGTASATAEETAESDDESDREA